MAISRVRAVLAALLVGGLGMGVVWVYGGLGTGAEVPGRPLRMVSSQRSFPTPGSVAPPATATDGEQPTTEVPSPSATKPSLEALRASDAFIEFAEARRAQAAPGAGLAYHSFGWRGADGEGYRFREPAALWNTVVAPIRDDLLRQGTEFREPLFDPDGKPSHPFVAFYPREPGAPQLVAFASPFIDEGGDVAIRVHAVLLDVVEEGPSRGEAGLRARMNPRTISPSQYDDWAALASKGIEPDLLAWALERGTGR